MKKISYVSIVILVLACLYSCNHDGSTNSPVFFLDTAITYTDEEGRYLGGATGDWCEGCDRSGPEPVCYSMQAAYPNPAPNTTYINFSIPNNDTHAMLYFLNFTDTVFVFNDIFKAGFYTVEINGNGLGLYNTHKRFYMKAGPFVCNGNIRFN